MESAATNKVIRVRFMTPSICSRIPHRHQRTTPHEPGRIRIRLWTILLRASAEHFREIQIPVGIRGDLMRCPRVPRPPPELPERELVVTREIELDDPIGEAVHRPYVLVGAH